MNTLKLSHHATERKAQRSISIEAIEFALHKGYKIYQNGVVLHIVLGKMITKDFQEPYRGTVVITGGNGQVITTYKNYKGLKKLRKAEDYYLRRQRQNSRRIA